jgi:uncharacterized protein
MNADLKRVVLYHGDCIDGFTAAWVCARGSLSGSRCVPMRHGADGGIPTLDANTSLVIVDFSFPRAVMEKLFAQVAEMIVLDHHKTAQADCEGLAFCRFDMERSGAGLTWDYFRSGPRPALVDYVEDRDLWRYALPKSREVNALIRSTEQTFQAWDALAALPVDEAAKQGVGCLKHIDAYVRAAVKHAFMARLGQQVLPLVNITYESCSEVADALCQQGHEVAGYWFERGDGKIQYGLRSSGDFDCSAVAKRYGGGGHMNASGFIVGAPVHERVGRQA